MPKTSAGLLLYRVTRAGGLEVLLVHPGGPLFAKKDLGHWTVPKGEIDAGEELLAAAHRELAEETGFTAAGPALELGTVKQKNGKIVHAWAVRGDADVTRLVSNEFELEWPPKSGRVRSFPEVDRAEWFALDEARRRIKAAQEPFLDRLAEKIGA
ncbi:MAG TPA: NUDIX domain-containing protein [Myxococcota bacterium]|nr:NUDIX domain-containing protein [Myxococcota bacterium]